MTLKEKLSKRIHDAVSSYDFENAIDDALDRIDIETVIGDEIRKRISKLDIEPILEDFVRDYIDEELDDVDIEAEMLRAMEDLL